MGTWARRAAMAAVGVVLAAAPLGVRGPRAEAASFVSNSQASLTYVTNSGPTVTCTVINNTTHNTDDPNQPYTLVSTGLSGSSVACIDSVLLSVTVSYRDKGGVRRNTVSQAFSTGSLKVEGTYSSITSTVTADYFFSCDSSQSAACAVSSPASPK